VGRKRTAVSKERWKAPKTSAESSTARPIESERESPWRSTPRKTSSSQTAGTTATTRRSQRRRRASAAVTSSPSAWRYSTGMEITKLWSQAIVQPSGMAPRMISSAAPKARGGAPRSASVRRGS
jgi:hypothetical protein